jgi:hypothetical protein
MVAGMKSNEQRAATGQYPILAWELPNQSKTSTNTLLTCIYTPRPLLSTEPLLPYLTRKKWN